MTCASCAHSVLKTWDYGDDDDHDDRAWLECRRFPPVLYVQRGVVRQMFPTAYETCGEWSPQDPASLGPSLASLPEPDLSRPQRSIVLSHEQTPVEAVVQMARWVRERLRR